MTEEKETEVPMKMYDWDIMWQDGKVVCADCGGYIRGYDAG